MLILCTGPDTFRAQAKARDLEQAFREKYDATGSSTERVALGKEGVDELIEKAGMISLFSPRRFLRGFDLLADCPKAKLAALGRVLAKEPENVIVVSVEAAPLPSSTLQTLGPDVKIIKYEFPEERGTAFEAFVRQAAKTLGLTDALLVKHVAEVADGDSWLAWNELIKASALGSTNLRRSGAEPTLYDFIDRFFQGGSERYAFAADEDAAGEIFSVLVSQLRAALRVRDADTNGLHPFLIKKMRAHTQSNLEKDFAHALAALLGQRFGLGVESELAALL